MNDFHPVRRKTAFDVRHIHTGTLLVGELSHEQAEAVCEAIKSFDCVTLSNARIMTMRYEARRVIDRMKRVEEMSK